MSNSIAKSPVAFHVSLNSSNIDRSVDFFSKVFGTPPAKHRPDYAKFEIPNPPMTISLEPVSPDERGPLNHVGFKFQSAEELVTFQRRLEMAGLSSQREEGVECCYAKQTKFWLHDPEGTLWEMYVLEGDLEHRGAGQDETSVSGNGYDQDSPNELQQISCSTSSASLPEPEVVRWSHRLGSPLEIPADFSSESLDEVSLQGTFNGEGTLPMMAPFLKEVSDRLRPGGRVALHCLTTDRHVEVLPALPGPASVVKSVPCLESLMDQLEESGFEAIRLTKYGSRACFTAGDAELRETMIEARKPNSINEGDSEQITVVYKGPLLELRLDNGTTLQRGRPTEMLPAAWNQLESSELRNAIVIIERAATPVSCTGS